MTQRANSDADPHHGPADMADMADEGQLVVFRLFGEEFGVRIDRVREIVRPPEMTPIPRAPDYVAGLCNLRGNVLPVIDTRVRFGMAAAEATDHTRLLVVESGGDSTGLIVDSMREVMRLRDARIEPPPAACRAVDREFLSGVVKVDAGRRLIMVLNLNEVLAVDAPGNGQSAAGGAAMTGGGAAEAGPGNDAEGEDRAGAAEEQLVSFRLAGEVYAFDIRHVSEIIKISGITRAPNAPAGVRGLFTIRDQLLPIIDLREILGLPTLASERSAVVAAAAREHQEWFDSLDHALAANRPFSGATVAKETPFGKWLEAYNSSSIAVEGLIKRLKRARADLFTAAGRLLRNQRRDGDETPSREQFREQGGALLAVVLDLLAGLESTMAENLLMDQRALVVRGNGMSVGYLVDWVDEVLRIPRSVIDEAPGLAASERGELRAVAKLNNGEKLIMIMDESALISGETGRAISEIKARAGGEATGGDAAEASVQGRAAQEVIDEVQLVTFTIDREEYAIPIMQVREINRASAITAVPRAPFFVDGMTNLRGNVLPVLNIRKLFGLADRESDDRTRIIIVDMDGGRTGLRVDQVNEVLRLSRRQIEKTPSVVVSGGANHFMEGVCKIDGGRRIVVLLDVGKVLDADQLRQMAELADAAPPEATMAAARKRPAAKAGAGGEAGKKAGTGSGTGSGASSGTGSGASSRTGSGASSEAGEKAGAERAAGTEVSAPAPSAAPDGPAVGKKRGKKRLEIAE